MTTNTPPETLRWIATAMRREDGEHYAIMAKDYAQKIPAIKELRSRYDLGLKEAKDIVEALVDALTGPDGLNALTFWQGDAPELRTPDEIWHWVNNNIPPAEIALVKTHPAGYVRLMAPSFGLNELTARRVHAFLVRHDVALVPRVETRVVRVAMNLNDLGSVANFVKACEALNAAGVDYEITAGPAV